MMRRAFVLTAHEQDQLNRLRSAPGEAFEFWKAIAAKLGVDYRTVIGTDEQNFSALPVGHGKHWCFPYSLACKSRRPQVVEKAD